GAAAENDFAMFLYGECLERGIGTEEDFGQALELYKKAAEKGGEEGLYRMALLYSEGHGVEKNLEKAKEYCMQVREDLTYSDTCVFEEDWKQEVETLLSSFRQAE
ncbi:MAG: sel1 repeat family protein, partial [Lachnospiraceae bacterium]|nr:sel1 repeat family protein [Lachnospiraceae bacterium]